MNELKTNGLSGKKLTQKAKQLLKDIGDVGSAIEVLHPILERVEVRKLKERISKLEVDLTKQSKEYETEKRGLYKRIAKLESKVFGLDTALDRKTQEDAHVRQQDVELQDLQKLHSDSVEKHKKRVDEWKAEKSQLRAEIVHLRGGSVNNDRFVDHLQTDITDTRSKLEALRIDLDPAKEDQWKLCREICCLEITNHWLLIDIESIFCPLI